MGKIPWNKGMAKGRSNESHINWSNLIKEKDNWKCQKCGELDKIKLIAHHIESWNDNIELRFDVNNGLTLCRSCHLRHHNKNPWNKGIKMSDETREKLKKSLKEGYLNGRKTWLQDTKGLQKPNDGSFKKGQFAWNKGKFFSEEAKEKMSRAKIGKPPWNKGLKKEAINV